MNAKAKTINILLYDGTLQGVVSIEDSSWNSGELYSTPRDSVEGLLATDACNKYGVYLLLSREKVYVGQSSDLAKRLSQHTVGKDWWESVVILTTKDDSLNHADIDYLESVLIDKARSVGRLDCNNKQKGANPKVDKFRKVFLGQYLEEALFLMELIGITVFSSERNEHRFASAATQKLTIGAVDVRTQLSLGKRVKREAVSFLKENGISLGKHVTYSALQSSRTEFWLNPQTRMLAQDWNLVLNDNQSNELIVLMVPAGALSLQGEGKTGLVARTDKPELIDLLISRKDLVDKRSNLDFSRFLVAKVKY